MLDRLVRDWHLETRSDVLRELIRLAPRFMPTGERPPEVAVNVRTSLQRMVSNGWVPDETTGLNLAAFRGFAALEQDFRLIAEAGQAPAEMLRRERDARRQANATGARILGEKE